MNRIAPAIIPESFSHLRESLERVRPFTREVQVDIVDGNFVPFVSWPYTKKSSPEDLAAFTALFFIEIDLMVMRPEDVIPLYARVGVRSMVVHLESTEALPSIIAQRDRLGFSLGLSLNNDTPLHALEEYIPHIEYVQFMGIGKIGSQGQPFDARVLERIMELKARHPDVSISIDGSVNDKTLPLLIEAGADRCVAGSFIMSSDDPEVSYNTLTALW